MIWFHKNQQNSDPLHVLPRFLAHLAFVRMEKQPFIYLDEGSSVEIT